MKSETPFVSVIIPWFSSREELERCLAACAVQTYPRDRFEIIVADNHAAALSPFGGAIFVHEPSPGSYKARAAASRECRGEVLAFTDADCTPKPDWIEQGVLALVKSGFRSIVGGKVVFYYRGERPNNFERYDSAVFLDQKRNIKERRFASTANLFVPSRVFAEVGGFDERLMSGGDADFCFRAVSRGFGIEYAERAAVLHPARHTFFALTKKMMRVAGGAYDRRRASREACASLVGFRLFPRKDPAFLMIRVALLFLAGYEYARRIAGGKARRS